jgi:cell division protein FtsI (penicillin-binding protein 3)
VSPLQLVKAASVIVNGGYKVEPTLVASNQKEAIREAVISTETSHRLRQLLRLNVAHGTGSKANVKGYMVGGKTGTADKPSRGGYDRNSRISSFLGFFPMDAPKYTVFVMIDEPKGIKETYGYATGGWVGAPTVSRVVASMAAVLGIEPQVKENNFGDNLLRYVKKKEQIKKERKIAAH